MGHKMKRTVVALACTECKRQNYSIYRNKKTHPERLETKKYCKWCRKHMGHKEVK